MYNETDELSNYVYEYLYGPTASYICYYIVLSMIIVVGPMLLIAIVLYEHYGADSQKRTILNRLSSTILIHIILVCVTLGILRILRDIFGLLPAAVGTWCLVFVKEMHYSGILFAGELTCFKFLYIVVWKRMKTINDEFWMRVLGISTYLVGFYMCLIEYSCGSVYEGAGIIHVASFSGMR